MGGADNILALEHCSTRLRFSLVDRAKVDREGLKKTAGVLGVIDAAQFQIVIGNNVVEVYDAILSDYAIGDGAVDASRGERQGVGATVLAAVVSIFQPLVPAIAGAGVLKSFLLLLNMLGVLATTDALYTMFAAISDATFYFLPVMVAATAAKTFRCNCLVATAAVGYLLLPATTTALTEGTMTVFGFTAPAIAYNAQVFPAILCVGCLALCERLFNRISPKPIRIFFVPMMSLAITVPATLYILGPLGYNAGQLLTTAILALYNTAGFLALGLLAAILPFMIAMGMHKAMIPYATAMMTDLGHEMLYLPASLAHNISECGACAAVALRTKDETLRQTALSASVSALMGITEPALYGVTLQHKRVMVGVVASGAISGTVLGLLGVRGLALVGPGLPSMTMFADAANPANLMFAFAGFALAAVVSFAATFVLWKDEAALDGAGASSAGPEVAAGAATEVAATSQHTAAGAAAVLQIVSPLRGAAEGLDQVPDEVFASKTLGDGIAIVPTEGVLHAPADATVSMVFPTNHAIGLTLAGGCELLLHVGIDTVKMEGRGFESFVAVGDAVAAGDKLLGFDLAAIAEAGFDPTVSIVVSNGSAWSVSDQAAGAVNPGEPLFKIEEK